MTHPIRSAVYIMNSKRYDTPDSQPGLNKELKRLRYTLFTSPVYIMNSKGYDTSYSQPGQHNELKRLWHTLFTARSTS